MSSQRNKQRRRSMDRAPGRRPTASEDRATEVVTIAWTVSVTAVLLADVVTIAAHLVARTNPELETAPVFAAIMLLTAAVMGAVSLALLPIVWRRRTVKPPLGYAVFATLVAAAPIAALVGRLLG